MKVRDNRPIIHDVRDLEKYGIYPLTSEACGYSMRTLCDVNDQGKQLLNDFFSVDFNFLGQRELEGMITPNQALDILSKFFGSSIRFPANWNSKVNGEKATGSIMITRSMFQDLAVFIMFHVEKVAFIAHGEFFPVYGYFADDGDATAEKLEAAGYKTMMNWAQRSSQPTVNGRAVHAFTGRVV